MPSSSEKSDLLTTALARFKVAASAEAEQRAREIDDLKFVDWDEQWPADIKASRSGTLTGGEGLPPVPPRPCLTINKLKVPVEQIANEARSARLALQFAPRGRGANRETAEAMEDICRGIQADSRANLARQWAFERAIKCGRGFYRIVTEYSNDGDFDQDIVYKRILNQSAVYMDPAAQEPDFSDARWAFIVQDMPKDEYVAAYPTSTLAKLAGDGPGDLSSIGDDQPGWVSCDNEGEAQLIRVAEHFYVVEETREIGLFTLPDGSTRTLRLDDPAVADAGAPQQTRSARVKTVKWCKINAKEVLEEQDWAGRYIPIVTVIAAEANANGKRQWTGLVAPAKDAQRSYNYMASAEAESVGLAPRAPFIGYYETVQPYMKWWQQANTRNFAMLPIAAVRGPNGETLPPPQRNVVEPAIQAIVIAKQGANEDIKSVTGRWDASLGHMAPSERSGKAILALQKQAEQGGSSGWIDNLAQMSIIYEGKILRDLIPKIYSRPGRVVSAIGVDEQSRPVMVNQPFVRQNGQPTPVQPGQDTGGKPVEHYDLTQGEYAVAVAVGKSFTTRREEAVAAMGQLAEAAPQLVPIYAHKWVEHMDFPGAHAVAKLLKQAAPVQEDDEEAALPPKVKAEMQKAQQMIDFLTKELDAKNDLIEKEQAKLDADLQKARMDNETKLTIAAIESETQIALAQQQERVEGLKLQANALEGAIASKEAELADLRSFNAETLARADQSRDAESQRMHERDMAAMQGEQQAGMQQQKGEQAAGLQQMKGDQAIDQTMGGEQQAALQREALDAQEPPS
jgi:hypothetical protein